MRIDNCYKCDEPVNEGTWWDISLKQGFLCEKCNIKNQLIDEEYHANAAFLKSLYKNKNLKQQGVKIF